MVAATKMRRAQNQAVSGRPYSENLSEALERLLPRVDTAEHPLLFGNESKNTGVILLSTDKGLVGALNTNLMRTAAHMEGGNIHYYTVGRKGRSFVVRMGKELEADFENVDQVSFRQAVQLTKMITEAYLTGELGEVYLIYPQFVSTLRQEAKRVKLLPIDIQSVSAREGEFLFEPNVDTLLDFILIHHIQTRIYQALLETKASEHSARMVAMQNATDNAEELVSDLQLTYNQTRQAAITTELLEITTAQVAME